MSLSVTGLSVAWPVAPEACAHLFESVTWLAAMQVVTSRCGGQPEKLAAIGLAEFTALVRQAVAGWGGQRPANLVCRAVFAALRQDGGRAEWPTPRPRRQRSSIRTVPCSPPARTAGGGDESAGQREGLAGLGPWICGHCVHG